MARYVPEDAQRQASRLSPSVVFLYKRGERLCAIGYVGKGEKSVFHHTFRSAAYRSKFVGDWMRAQDANAIAKVERAAAKKAALAKPHGLVLGDILSATWGYDQTNVDYYQVVRLIGKRSVGIRKIGASEVEATSSMSGQVIPTKGVFQGDEIVKRVDERDGVRIASYAYASKVVVMKTAAGDVLGYGAQSYSTWA